MSARHRQVKKALAIMASEHKRLSGLENAFRIVRAYLKVTTVQNLAVAHGVIEHQLSFLEMRMAELKPKAAAKPKRKVTR